MAAGIKFLEQKLKDAGTLQNAVNVLLKWYEGNDIVFFRTFVEQLPVYLQSSVIPNGGATGQALVKLSDEDGDYNWADVNTSNNLDLATYDPAEKAEQVLTVSDATNFATASQGALAETAVQPASTDTLTNKTIIDYTNHIHADAVHHRIKCIDPTGVTPGTAVAFAGWNSGGEAIEVVRANNTTSIAIGIVLETLANGEFGLMVMSGTIDGIDTTTFPKGAGVAQQGDILYVNGNGQLTGDEPTTGFEQPIAYVLRSHAVNGALQVLAYYPLQDAEDVRIDPISGMTSANVQTALAELNTLRSATLTTGGTVKFDKTYIHNSPLTPLTGDITFDATDAVEGSSAIICHQQTTAPSINTGGLTISKTIGSYVEGDPAQYNEIVLTYIGNGYVTVTYRASATSYELPTLTGNAKKVAAVNDGETDLQYSDMYWDATTGEFRVGTTSATGSKFAVKGENNLSNKSAVKYYDSDDRVMSELKNNGTWHYYGKAATAMNLVSFYDRSGNIKSYFRSANNVDAVYFYTNTIYQATTNGIMYIGAGTGNVSINRAYFSPNPYSGDMYNATNTYSSRLVGRVNSAPATIYGNYAQATLFASTQLANNIDHYTQFVDVIVKGTNLNLTSVFEYKHNAFAARLGAGTAIGEISDAITYKENGFTTLINPTYKSSKWDKTNKAFQLLKNGATIGDNDMYSFYSDFGMFAPFIPTYADDAAADADATLLSGAFYKTTGSRAILQKP